MRLAINLTCPQCGQIERLDLKDFNPCPPRRCSACGARLMLTADSLHQFAHDLRQRFPC